MKKTVFIIVLFLLSIHLIGQSNGKEDLPEVGFFPQGGYYNQSVEVELFAPDAKIFYTLDGQEPSRKSRRYSQPIRLTSTTVIRAIAYQKGKWSPELTQTFFIREPASNLMVVSLAIPPAYLFDPEEGLFMQGSKADQTSWSLPGANFWRRDEVPIHTEIFESDGRVVFNSGTGLRLFGGMSRLFPQKSMALVIDETYGEKKIKHRVFGKQGPKSFKFLVLRNSGSDFGKTHFRDALLTGLLDHWDIEKQAYRPAHVYINGKYWGIYNIREKVNKHFISDHQDVDKDSIDLLEHFLVRKQGSRLHYQRMLKYLEKNSLNNPANYAYLQGLIEVENFLNYQIAQIYFDNQDAGGNIKYWRPQRPNGRWRWILFDTDWGFGLHDPYAYQNNSLAFHTDANGPKWPNPPWSTFLLRKLLENPDFERAFVNSIADHLNSTFQPHRVIQHIDRYHQTLIPEIPRHLERWRLDPQNWEDQVDRLRVFARERPQYVRMHLMERFHTGGMRQLEAQASEGGRILINGQVEVGKELFEGTYYEHYPIQLEVVPNFGYRFSHWEGDLSGTLRQMPLQLRNKNTSIRAVFEKYDHPLSGKIIINEISANNRKSGDWVEIFNYSDQKVTLSDWFFNDAKNEFEIPPAYINSNDYLILCEDAKKFKKAFPEAYNVIGDMDFGINKSQESLMLFSEQGAMVDSLSYDIMPTDSVFTFSFLLPHLDNSDLENWRLLPGEGSPNAANPYYVESRIRYVQSQWIQIGIAASVFLISLLILFFRVKGNSKIQ